MIITSDRATIRIVEFAFVFITSIEILRVLFLAIKRKKNNAWVIGMGVSVFTVGILSAIIYGLAGGQVNSIYVIFILLFSIPLSMSIYLARSSSQTNKNLETQLATVKQLSEEAIEQEKTAAKLAIETQLVRAENERKTQELEYAKELQKTLTNLKSTQAQLIHAEKMASLGELTAGIAHEIKNPLNFVNNFSEVSNELVDEIKELLQKENNKEGLEIVKDLKQNLDKINQHGKRADSIVKGMLLHSRGTSGEKTPTDINDLLDQYINLAYHGMRAQNKEFNITIEKDYDETLEKINVVPQDISRVFLNIINNACYAAYDRKKKSSDDGFLPTLKVSTKGLNEKVEIRIGDNGEGIPKDILDKIFQPFFTTKPTGEGTGLGLSLSYDIVTKVHGGKLRVETKEDMGTEFIIILNN
jgi:signal transduction histidine kinase